jgi:hypothetical protein
MISHRKPLRAVVRPGDSFAVETPDGDQILIEVGRASTNASRGVFALMISAPPEFEIIDDRPLRREPVPGPPGPRPEIDPRPATALLRMASRMLARGGQGPEVSELCRRAAAFVAEVRAERDATSRGG